MNKIYKAFTKLHLPRLTIYLFLAALAFSTQGWCGRECLGLSSDEIQDKEVGRVLRNMNNFFIRHESQLLELKNQQPEAFVSIAGGKKPHCVFFETTKETFKAIRKNQDTFIGQDYADDPQLLRTHLKQVKQVVKAGPSDLDQENANILKMYINLLLFISKF